MLEGTDLRPETIQIFVEVFDTILPELAHGEHLRLVRLFAHGLDEVGDEAAVDVLYYPYTS